MLSKVDHTVDCRDFKLKSQLLQLVDCRFFVDFAVDFPSDFSGKVEEFVQNGLKIFKNFRHSRLRGRSEILQKLTFLEKVDRTVDYGFKS
jgi:hypothetical protein